MDAQRRMGHRYEVLEPIGRGGMADVYRGRDTVLGRQVALKVLRDVSDVDRERFAGEARVLAALDHEAIVRLYDAGVDDDEPWLALELVDGRSLAALLAQGPLPAQRLAGLGAQVARALAHAHDRGVVHRDVKPANVLVSDGDRARLADFGIARLAGVGAALTMTGHTIGTAAYLAPEQVRGEPTTGAADVYALGLVLLEALTGRRAFDGPPVEAALVRLQHGPLIPTSLPHGWPALVAAMTAAAPEERPGAAAVAVRLGALAADRGGVAVGPVDDPTTAVPIVVPAARRSRRRAVPLLVAAAVLAVVAAGTVVSRGGGEPSAAEAADTPAASGTRTERPDRPTRSRPADGSPTTSIPDPAPVVATSTGPAPRATTPAPRAEPRGGKGGPKTKGPGGKGGPKAKGGPGGKGGPKAKGGPGGKGGPGTKGGPGRGGPGPGKGKGKGKGRG